MPIKDSLSKCDTYSNPFDTKNYGIKTHRNEPAHKATSFTKDVLEISQETVKKDAMQYLDSAANRVPSGLYVVVCRVGKYTFLALTMPPYFLLFAFPKWLFVQLIPTAAKTIVRPLLSLVKIVQNSIKVAVHVIWQPIMRFFHRIELAMKKFGKKVSVVGSRIKETVNRVFNKTIAFITRPFKQAYKQAYEMVKGVFHAITHPLATMKQMSQAMVRPVIHVFKRIATRVSALKEKGSKTLKNVRKWVSNKTETWSQGLQGTFASAAQLANHITQWIWRTANAPIEKIGKGFKSLKGHLNGLFKPVAKGIEAMFQVVRQQIERLKEKVVHLVEPLQRFGESMAKQSREFFNQGKAFATEVIQSVYKHLPEHVQRFLTENPWVLLLRRLIKVFWKLMAAPIKLVVYILRRAWNTAQQIPGTVKNTMEKVSTGAKQCWEYILAPVKQVKRAGITVLRTIVYWSLIIIILFGYTVGFACRLVVNSTGRAMERLRMKA